MGNERRDYLLAFLIGAVTGIGAAFLLSSAKDRKRLARPLERGVKRFRKRGRRRSRLLSR